MAEQITIQVTENKTINVSDVLGNLKITDAAPTAQGLYILSDAGTYANLGGLVATADKLNYAYFDGTTWSLFSAQIPNYSVNTTLNPTDNTKGSTDKAVADFVNLKLSTILTTSFERNKILPNNYTVLSNTSVKGTGIITPITGVETFKIEIKKGNYILTVGSKDTTYYIFVIKDSNGNTVGFSNQISDGLQVNNLSELYFMEGDETANNYDKFEQKITVVSDGFLYITKSFTTTGFSRDISSIKITPIIAYDNYFKNKKIICAGDSVTDGRNGGYTYLIERNLGCTVQKNAKSGGNTATLVSLLTNMTRTAYVALNQSYSDIEAVTIMIGTNGGVTGTINDIPTAKKSDYANEADFWALFPNTFFGNLGLCIEYIKDKNPTTKIYLITPILSNTTTVEAIRTAMYDLKSYYNIKIIDVWDNCGINAKNVSLFMGDTLHPNYKGNKIIGDYVSQKIMNL